MKTKNQFLASIATVATIFLLVLCRVAYSQINYTDLNPDVTNASSYSLDLNNDGTFDYSVAKTSSSTCCKTCYWNGNSSSVTLNLLNGNSVVILNGYPAALDSGTIISASNTWSSSGGFLLHYYAQTIYSQGSCHPISVSYSGNWSSMKYLGLKLIVGANTYYGWTRLTVSSSTSFTVHDYTFNTVANQSILAGQTCPPQAAIIANGSTTFCVGDSVILSSASTGTNLSYHWKMNAANIPGATNKSLTAKVAGNYKVNVTDNANSSKQFTHCLS
ncbi:MAG: hypothetical protein IPO83_16235 [Chitinophagaceae bacterium]|nr:hypothetical protein [Chitinophagaceae bacterium]